MENPAYLDSDQSVYDGPVGPTLPLKGPGPHLPQGPILASLEGPGGPIVAPSMSHRRSHGSQRSHQLPHHLSNAHLHNGRLMGVTGVPQGLYPPDAPALYPDHAAMLPPLYPHVPTHTLPAHGLPPHGIPTHTLPAHGLSHAHAVGLATHGGALEPLYSCQAPRGHEHVYQCPGHRGHQPGSHASSSHGHSGSHSSSQHSGHSTGHSSDLTHDSSEPRGGDYYGGSDYSSTEPIYAQPQLGPGAYLASPSLPSVSAMLTPPSATTTTSTAGIARPCKPPPASATSTPKLKRQGLVDAWKTKVRRS